MTNNTMMVLSVVSIVLAVAALVFTGHLAIVYQRFNDQIKSWSQGLDDSMMDAVNRASRNILRELDEKINEKNETLNEKENE